MLKIKKEIIRKVDIKLSIDSNLKKELEFYLKVAKHNDYISKETNLNELIEEALKELVNGKEYLELKSDYIEIDKEKREAMRLAKEAQRKRAKAEKN